MFGSDVIEKYGNLLIPSPLAGSDYETLPSSYKEARRTFDRRVEREDRRVERELAIANLGLIVTEPNLFTSVATPVRASGFLDDEMMSSPGAYDGFSEDETLPDVLSVMYVCL